MGYLDPPPRARFRVRQRFCLAPEGRTAEAAYRSQVAAARGVGGRKAFEAARREWADERGLQPDDGAYLVELRIGPTSLSEIAESLAVCGQSQRDAMSAIGRLVDAGLVNGIES